MKEFVTLQEDVSASPLYSDDLAPVTAENRNWSMWHLAFTWVGMAVCIPTYMLASFMIRSGLSWYAALIIIGLANLVITIPMALNGHAGVKYGIPFPVLGRAPFGIHGIHIPAIMRAIVACGWFGIQTWVGGLACYAIWNAATGNVDPPGINFGEYVSFGFFWLINMYFVWKGTNSIRWLEEYSAPILIAMGIALIVWGGVTAGGFNIVLQQSKQLENPTLQYWQDASQAELHIVPIKDINGRNKASDYRILRDTVPVTAWLPIEPTAHDVKYRSPELNAAFREKQTNLGVQLQCQEAQGKTIRSSVLKIDTQIQNDSGSIIWIYLLAFTGMVGFWATMSISIADITRYANTQRAQIRGQFIGLPGTMILYSFVGIFVTCAAVVNFQDVLVAEDAPWDPVSLLSRFENPIVVIIAQIMMLIATLSTNIAANVIAPANAFSNLSPKRISFKTGGTITGVIGILICPWWLMNEIAPALILISALLGPVLGIMVADYYIVRKKNLVLEDLFKLQGKYTYSGGFNRVAFLALTLGIGMALVGYFVPVLQFLYNLSWFTGFGVAFVIYILGMNTGKSKAPN